MRQWAGIVDLTPDSSPILGRVPGLANAYLSCGWGSYGFKAIPGGGSTLAHTIARDEVHPLIAPFSLERFTSGPALNRPCRPHRGSRATATPG